MFAFIAAVIWLLAAFGVHFGSVNMLLLGLGIFALHFVWVIPIPGPAGWRRSE